MKQQYTYQLDEEKIRRELRERRTTASSEEAYQKFCAYSDAHSTHLSSRSGSMNLKIDRKYMVPAAAVIVVLVLSLLLANFAGSAPDRKSMVNTKEPFVPMPQLETELVIPQPDTHEEPAPVATENSKALETPKPQVVREKKPEGKNPDKPSELKPENALAGAAPDKPLKTGTVQPATTQTETKKPRRDAADLLEPVQLPDIRPTLLSPEQEEDIRIN